MSDEDWGPWIEHDGKGCPCVGMEVQAEFSDGSIDQFFAGCDGGRSWLWGSGFVPVIRYRIRKFRAEQTLREIAENIREPEAV